MYRVTWWSVTPGWGETYPGRSVILAPTLVRLVTHRLFLLTAPRFHREMLAVSRSHSFTR